MKERKWIPRNQVAAPTTIAQVHEEVNPPTFATIEPLLTVSTQAAKQRAQAEKEAANRTLTMSRGGSRRGGDRGGGPAGEQQADGWSVAGGSTPRPPPKAGDLSNFGKINKSASVVMGPSSVWAGKKDAAKRDSTLSRVNSSSNMFMMLGRDAEAMPETGSKPSRPSSRRTSVDLGSWAMFTEPQRKKLQLLPRSKPLEEGEQGQRWFCGSVRRRRRQRRRSPRDAVRRSKQEDRRGHQGVLFRSQHRRV
jgi:translation initiation factor 4G